MKNVPHAITGGSLPVARRAETSATRFVPGIVFTPEGHFLITEITPAVEQLVELASLPLREVSQSA
jgi:MoxR-like ATPase